jgi:hypothetical protein
MRTPIRFKNIYNLVLQTGPPWISTGAEPGEFSEQRYSVCSSSSCLLALQLCVGLYLFHGFSGGFATLTFSGVGSLVPRPTPNLEDQGLHFVWPLSTDLSGIDGSTRSLRSRQQSFPGHWGAPLHDKAMVVLEENSIYYGTKTPKYPIFRGK